MHARIIESTKATDGWIAKTLPKGKICFIANLNQVIQEISSGQIWEYQTIKDTDRYTLIQLIARVKPLNQDSNQDSNQA